MTGASTQSTCSLITGVQYRTSLTPPPWVIGLSVTEEERGGVQTETSGILGKPDMSTTDTVTKPGTGTKVRTRR